MLLNASERGFTLFETIVATGILVTALAGVAQLFVLGTHLTRQAGASGRALVAAQDKLESLRGQPSGTIPAGPP
jgi:type II secretory pathway pseudopilin PulG